MKPKKKAIRGRHKTVGYYLTAGSDLWNKKRVGEMGLSGGEDKSKIYQKLCYNDKES